MLNRSIKLTLPRREYLRKHFEVTGAILSKNLRPLDCELLAELLIAKGDVMSPLVNAAVRKKVMTKLGWSPQNLLNNLRLLISKNVLIKTGKVITLNEKFFPAPDSMIFSIQLIFDGTESE